MITGAHFLLYTTDPVADRAFFRDVLKFRFVDAGEGWLIFALPPAEIGVHPAGRDFVQRHADQDLAGIVLYLMCDDLNAAIARLRAAKVRTARVRRAEWGRFTVVTLPSGARIGLYQPTHASPLTPSPKRRRRRRGARRAEPT